MHNKGNEKPKNLKGTMIRLFKMLDNYKKYILIAVLLAAFSSALSIIGPNKISSLTDEISKGIMINTKALKDISNNIGNDFKGNNFQLVTKELMTPDINETTINNILMDENIPTDAKQNIANALISPSSFDINNIDELVKNYLYNDKVINNTLITREERLAFIKICNSLNKEPLDESSILKLIEIYPESIKKIILTDYNYNGNIITKDDKLAFIKLMSNAKDYKDGTKIYKTLDKMPKSIYNSIKPSMNKNKIKNISLFLLMIYLLSASFNFIDSIIMAHVSNAFAKELRDKIEKKINKLPLKYFDNAKTGDILSRTTNDIDTIGNSMNQSMAGLVGAITLFLAAIIMMIKTNYIMALAAIISSFIGFILMMIIGMKSQKYFKTRQIELGKLNADITEAYTMHNIIKAYNGEDEEEKKFDELNEKVYEANRKSQFLTGLMPPIMGFIGNFSYVAVCVVGAYLTINGDITFGVIVAFMIYARLFTSPLTQIAQGVTSIQQIAASSERVFEILDEEEEPKETKKNILDKKEAKGNIEFKDVRFSYDKDKEIIKGFSAKIKSGSKVAIVGPTGAGKTTIVNLLMKFYTIDSGDIIIDGHSINDLTRENIHDLFTMVLQDTWLFKGTIRDNVKFNDKVTDERIWKALDYIGVSHYVKTLPAALDYELKESDEISQGEKQLLTIARGMLKNAPFLILDEATSSVDTRTEELVQKAMDKISEGKTSFIIAHRLSTIKNADLILVMKDGDIIEKGTHNSLLKKKGFYAELYNSQFKK